MFITTVIVAYMAYTHVVCASMHVLFPVRKFLLCAIAFAPGKLRVVLKVADQSRAGSHFNLQNTHSQFRNSHFTRVLEHCSDPVINLYTACRALHDDSTRTFNHETFFDD